MFQFVAKRIKAYLRDLSIPKKLAMLQILPWASLLWAALILSNHLLVQYRSARASEAALQTATKAGDSVHEIQKERGLSNAFLASHGELDPLAPQRQATDLAIAASEGPGTARLAELRRQVDGRGIPAADAFKAYSAIISELLTGQEIRGLEGHAERGLHALNQLQLAGEAAAQERGFVNGLVAAQAYSPAQLARVHVLETQRAERLTFATQLVIPELKPILAPLQDAQQDATVASALAELATHDSGPWTFTREQWWAAASARLDPYHTSSSALGRSLARAAGRDASAARLEFIIYSLGFLLFLALGVGILSPFTSSNLVRPIRALARIMHNTDLSTRLKMTGKDEIGQLAQAFNSYQERNTATIRKVNHESSRLASLAVTIDSATGEMRASTALVAEGADAQRHVADQIANAIHQFSKAINEVTHSTSVALGTSSQARELASQGGRSGQASQEAMKAIQGTTSRILSAVQVIQEIASQTNLLSLNAAIEAAKAGTLGAGFAVVADEIRKLAERSAGAAREISSLIQEADAAVTCGVTDVAAAAQALSAIEGQVQELALLIEGIGAATQEEAAMGAEITRQVEASRLAAASNASGAVQLAASVDSVAHSVEDLTRATDVFAREMASFRLAEQSGALQAKDAIAAHQLWKGRLLAVIDGKSSEQLDPTLVSRDDACALGKWIHHPATPHSHPGFKRMQERHAAFHACAGQILREAQGGRADQARSLVESKLTPLTREVVQLLNSII